MYKPREGESDILLTRRPNKLGFCLYMLLLIVVLCGCNAQKIVNHYYLLLMGESQSWKLTGYEIVLTSDTFKAGNGTLTMKNVEKYLTENFGFKTYMIINGEDTLVHTHYVTGNNINIAEDTIGTIEGGTYFNKKGDAITLDDVTGIYMVIEWWDIDKGEDVKERIDLYNKE